MGKSSKPIMILMADDDPDDRMLTQEAFEECRLSNDLRFVEDGEELMDYLHCKGKYAEPKDSPRPGLILLDLNMPRKGRSGGPGRNQIRSGTSAHSHCGVDHIQGGGGHPAQL